MAMRVVRTPSGLSRRERYTAVASPSTLGLVATHIAEVSVAVAAQAADTYVTIRGLQARDSQLLRSHAAKG